MTNKQLFDLGWLAAENGADRGWCLQYGDPCLAGWKAYWDANGPS